MMHSHHHQTTAPAPSHQVNPSPPPSISLRSPASAPPNNTSNDCTPTSASTPHSQQPHSVNHLISLGRGDHYLPLGPSPAQNQPQDSSSSVLTRVRLSDILPYDGAPAGPYVRAVEALSGSLMRHNAAVIEVGCDDAALLRCGLEAARLFFRTRTAQGQGGAGGWGKGSRGVYAYRPGR